MVAFSALLIVRLPPPPARATLKFHNLTERTHSAALTGALLLRAP